MCPWLSSNDKIIYCALADKFEWCENFHRLTEQRMMEISIRKLSEQTGIDRRALRKSIDKLCDVGLITEHKTLGGKSYYTVEVGLDEVSAALRLGCSSMAVYGSQMYGKKKAQ